MNSPLRQKRRALNKSVEICVMLAGFALIPVMVSAQDEILLDDTQTHLEDNQARRPAVNDKKRKAIAGLAAVSGIAILGVGVIAATMMWAKRLRRLARDSGPSQTTLGNDFWFLKPPKNVFDEPERSNGHRPPSGERGDKP